MYFCCFHKQATEFKKVVIEQSVKIETFYEEEVFTLQCTASYTSLMTVKKKSGKMKEGAMKH